MPYMFYSLGVDDDLFLAEAFQDGVEQRPQRNGFDLFQDFAVFQGRQLQQAVDDVLDAAGLAADVGHESGAPLGRHVFAQKLRRPADGR